MRWGWIIGGTLLVGGVALLARSAAASDASPEDDKPDPQGGALVVRHGVAHDGCKHFELRDYDALDAWVRSNALSFVGWLGQLEQVQEDPKPFVVDVFGKLFPECSWPPPSSTTFGPGRQGFDAAIAEVKAQMGTRSGDVLTKFLLAIRRVMGGGEA